MYMDMGATLGYYYISDVLRTHIQRDAHIYHLILQEDSSHFDTDPYDIVNWCPN